MLWGFVAALTGMAFYAAASLAQGYAARRRTGPAVLHHPAYLAGLVCDGLAFAVSLVAFARLPLFVVQALLAGSLAVTVVAAVPLLKIRPTGPEWAAVALTTLGLVVVSASAGAESDSPSPGWFAPALWAVVAGVAVAGALAYRRGRGGLLGALAGLGYSVAALGARGAHLGSHGLLGALADPLVWAIAAGGLIGVVLYGRALEHGVGAATAALWVVEVVFPGAVGVFALGDPIRPGWALPAAAGVAMCVVGCLVLARSKAQG